MQDLKIQYRLLVYFTSLTVCSGDIKKKKKKNFENEKKKRKKSSKMTSQLVIFRAFFFPSPPPTLNLKKILKSPNKKKSGLMIKWSMAEPDRNEMRHSYGTPEIFFFKNMTTEKYNEA